MGRSGGALAGSFAAADAVLARAQTTNGRTTTHNRIARRALMPESPSRRGPPRRSVAPHARCANTLATHGPVPAGRAAWHADREREPYLRWPAIQTDRLLHR